MVLTPVMSGQNFGKSLLHIKYCKIFSDSPWLLSVLPIVIIGNYRSVIEGKDPKGPMVL